MLAPHGQGTVGIGLAGVRRTQTLYYYLLLIVCPTDFLTIRLHNFPRCPFLKSEYQRRPILSMSKQYLYLKFQIQMSKPQKYCLKTWLAVKIIPSVLFWVLWLYVSLFYDLQKLCVSLTITRVSLTDNVTFSCFGHINLRCLWIGQDSYTNQNLIKKILTISWHVRDFRRVGGLNFFRNLSFCGPFQQRSYSIKANCRPSVCKYDCQVQGET